MFKDMRSEMPDDFEKSAEDMCIKFQKNANLKKQQIPEGLTEEEENTFLRIAASKNLTISKKYICGKKLIYLTKPDF